MGRRFCVLVGVALTVFGVLVVATCGRVVFLEFPGFGEIVAFAGDSGKGDSHQQQGE